MTRAFDLALHRAKNMSRPRSSNLPKITIGIDFNQSSIPMAGRGGLSSIQKRMNIGGEPHRLAYINSDEDSLLKHLGGLGQPVRGTRGVPAYIGVTDDPEGYDIDVATLSADEEAAQEATSRAAVEELTKAQEAAASNIFSTAQGETDYEAAGYPGFHGMGGFGGVFGHPDPGSLGFGDFGYSPPPPDKDSGLSMKDVFTMGWPGLLVYGLDKLYTGFQKSMQDRQDLVDFIDHPNTTPAQKQSAQAELDALDKGGPEDLDYPSEEPVKKDKKIVEKEEEKEAKKLRGMAAYFAKMGGVTSGFTDEEIELLKSVYPPDHPIWETINRERKPMWPSIEEETAEV